MARDLSCDSGKKAYKTKRDAVAANPDAAVKRCARCRWWHVAANRRRSGGTAKWNRVHHTQRRGGGTRK